MLRTLIGAAAACLLAGLPLGTTADAHDGAPVVVLDRPSADGDAVTLSGRAPGHTRVVLQRRSGAVWRDVRTLPVRDGRYRTHVDRAAEDQRYRTRDGRTTSQARTVTARDPADGCGTRPRKSDGTYWSCTFVDDFNGSALDRTKWTPQTVFSSGNYLGAYACYYDDPANVSVSGGYLNLTVRKVATARPCTNTVPLLPTTYTAGMVTTYHKFSQQYGRFEARFRSTATQAPGLQESWWLWPDDRSGSVLTWPLAGEIDIAETYSSYPTLGIPYLHYTENDNGGPVPGVNTAWNCTATRGAFNTYTLEWSASRIEIFVNGRSCLVNTSGDNAFRKQYILNLTQALGYGSNSYTGTAPLPATTTVDYVKVWR